MKILFFFAGIILASSVVRGNVLPDDTDNTAPQAFPHHPYIPSSDPKARGACPALNTLANHGFIARNGRNVTFADL